MDLLKSRIKKYLYLSLFASVCLPAGIPCIVLGAVNAVYPVMIIGIVATVFGFYGCPLLWMKFASLTGMKKLVVAVESDNLYTVRELCSVLNISEREARARLRSALSERYLTGFKFEDDKLILNTNFKQSNASFTIKCEDCGAPVIIDPKSAENVCQYCGKVYRNVRPPEAKQ
ncbi:MAG: hypothetical protein ACLTEK_06565 [Christensenellales bacterium]